MLRPFLFIAGALALAGSVWVWTSAKTSFSGFSDDKLAQLEEELARVGEAKTAEGEEARVSVSMIADERRRRRLRYPLPALGLALVVLGFTTGARRARRSAPVTDEDLRLQAAIGDTRGLEDAAVTKAAELLGVSPGAPTDVIRAAFDAQRKLHAERAEGVAPDLQHLLRHRLEELERARDLLLARKKR